MLRVELPQWNIFALECASKYSIEAVELIFGLDMIYSTFADFVIRWAYFDCTWNGDDERREFFPCPDTERTGHSDNEWVAARPILVLLTDDERVLPGHCVISLLYEQNGQWRVVCMFFFLGCMIEGVDMCHVNPFYAIDIISVLPCIFARVWETTADNEDEDVKSVRQI